MAILKGTTSVTKFVRNLRGGSQPILARASDGLLYVVKFASNLQGANLPFNESIGNELYRACGLAVPSWKPLLVTDAFIDQNRDCWTQTPEGSLRPDSGLCFGSSFLGGDGAQLLEILPGTSFKRVSNHQSFWLAWMIDICAHHADNRQAIFLEDGKGELEGYFIDNGHLFGGPKGEKRPYFLASRYLDQRIYQSISSQYSMDMPRIAASLDVDQLWQRMQALPDDWRTASGAARFEQCLGRLSDAKLLGNVVDTMIDAQQRGIRCKGRTPYFEREPSVLRVGVQAARFGSRLIREADGCTACPQEPGGRASLFCSFRVA